MTLKMRKIVTTKPFVDFFIFIFCYVPSVTESPVHIHSVKEYEKMCVCGDTLYIIRGDINTNNSINPSLNLTGNQSV